MYKNVQVYDSGSDRWMDYSVTPTANEFRGYVNDSKGRTFMFTKPDADYEYTSSIPTYYTGVTLGKTHTRKPSVYKYSPIFRKDEYKYQYTNVIRKTKEEIHDVYYNARRNRFLDKVSTSNWFNETYGFVY
jgi:hypothetical protein